MPILIKINKKTAALSKLSDVTHDTQKSKSSLSWKKSSENKLPSKYLNSVSDKNESKEGKDCSSKSKEGKDCCNRQMISQFEHGENGVSDQNVVYFKTIEERKDDTEVDESFENEMVQRIKQLNPSTSEISDAQLDPNSAKGAGGLDRELQGEPSYGNETVESSRSTEAEKDIEDFFDFYSLTQAWSMNLIRDQVVSQCFEILEQKKKKNSRETYPLASQSIKATFAVRPRDHSIGVVRSFIAAVAEALKALPSMPKDGVENVSLMNEDAPFFRQMENTQYCPVPGTCSDARINAFRNVGRMIGLCLQQREIFPIQFARHLLNFILKIPLTWFDLAFYDPNLFDSMRSIVFDDQRAGPQNAASNEALQLTFTLTYSEAEGGKTIELKPGGKDIEVTRENFAEFAELIVEMNLYGPSLPVMEAIRTGVFDILPLQILCGCESDVLRKMLCGNPGIIVARDEIMDDKEGSCGDIVSGDTETLDVPDGSANPPPALPTMKSNGAAPLPPPPPKDKCREKYKFTQCTVTSKEFKKQRTDEKNGRTKIMIATKTVKEISSSLQNAGFQVLETSYGIKAAGYVEVSKKVFVEIQPDDVNVWSVWLFTPCYSKMEDDLMDYLIAKMLG